MAVIYNINSEYGYDIASYYAAKRAVPEKYIIGISVTTDEVISKEYYYSMIRDKIKAEILSRGIKDKIKYLVTTKGMPLKIDVLGDPCQVYQQDGGGAVESFLCLLFEEGSDYCLNTRIINRYNNAGIPFTSFTYEYSSFCPEEVTGTISYLVSRLDAYTPQDIYRMIDKSVNADRSGKGFYIIDDHPGAAGYEPWTFSNAAGNLAESGFKPYVIFDSTTSHILSDTLNNKDIIAYCSRGNHAVNINYTPASLGWTDQYGYLGGNRFNWLNGAVLITYESFNGYSFYLEDDGCPLQQLGHRDNQNLIADFIKDGGTAGIGNVYEPFVSGTSKVDVFFKQYAEGHYFIDAAYMSLNFVKGMNVVTGDPLCRISDRIHNDTPADTGAQRVSLYRNYPNPFNSGTTISFTNNASQHIQLKLYNILGEEVMVLINELLDAGDYSVPLSADHLPSGVYFYRLTAGGSISSGKMVKVR